jgi:two-component system NarL family sensor kinase
MQTKLSEVALLMVGSTMIILLLTSLIITYMFINQKRKLRHVHELNDLKNSYDREILQTRLEIQDQTLKTISRELHDNVGTIVSIALVHVKSMIPVENEREQQKVAEVSGLLNEAIDTLRDISKSINSDNITRDGWLHGFLLELDRVRKIKLFEISSSVEGTGFDLEPSKQLILFRLLQEAMNNIVKHAEAKRVDVKVSFSGNRLSIVIRDNGKGFDHTGSLTDGSGIRNMQARAAMLPALLNIHSIQGNGTTVEFIYEKDPFQKPA